MHAYEAWNPCVRAAPEVWIEHAEAGSVDENRATSDISAEDERRLRARVSALERLNAELSAREERFRTIVINATDAITVAQDGVLKLINPNVSDISGHDEATLLSMPFSEFIHPDDRAMIADIHLRHLRGEDSGEAYTIRMIAAGGEIRTVEVRSVLIQWEQRPAVLSFLHDVTLRLEAERSLKDSETLYRSLFNQANDAVFIMRGDRFIDCNARTLEIFGCTRDQIIDQPPYGFSPRQQHDGRDSRESAIEKITSAIAGVPQRFEWLHARYDGTTFDAEVSLGCVEVGGEKLIQAFVRDISERKWIERIQSTLLGISQTAHSARSLEELFCAIRGALSALMDTTNFYVALYDEPSDTYRFECFYDEFDEVELHAPVGGNGSATDFVRRGAKPLLVSATEFNELAGREELHRGGTPSKSWLGVPLMTQRGVLGVAVVQSYVDENAYTRRELDLMSFVAENLGTAIVRLQDEENKAELEQQVRQARKFESLGVLAGGIAHDFNNLLTGILGNADLALLDLPRTSSAAVALNEIRNISQRASELCRQMLAYSGRAATAPESLDLAAEVRGMRDVLKSLVPETVTFTLDAAPAGAVNADRAQLAQVVRTLVTNSVEALDGSPGEISITTGTTCPRGTSRPGIAGTDTLPGGTACPFIEVRDTGCGMDEETQRRVFEPFFSTKFTGRGLGLPAVQGMVRMHGGTINVASAPGEGTTMRVVLPPSDTETTSNTEEREVMENPRPELIRTTRVLLVDDEDVVRNIGEVLLDKAGYTVTTAANGQCALEFFREHSEEIACVVLDLSMPDMDGGQVFEMMRDVRPDVPILISSGYSGDDVMARFEKCDHWGFLQKPFSSDSLISEVSRVMGDAHRPS